MGETPMSLIIDFSPAEEARLHEVAESEGLQPADLVKRLIIEHLPGVTPTDPIERMRARILEWQTQDETPILTASPPPNGLTPTAALFQQWEAEEAAMTEEERAANEKLWEEVQQGI